MPKASTLSEYYSVGVQQTGAPYSNVSGENGFLGRDVSFYTFLSALANPKSKLYTVDYRTEDEYSKKASYYGVVCSSAVEFIWGIPATYISSDIYNNRVPFISKKESQNIQDLRLYDALCKDGHIKIVSGIARDADGLVQQITVFESVSPLTRTTVYTPDELTANMTESSNNPYYVYSFDSASMYGEYSLPSYAEQTLSDIRSYTFPGALCTERGDKVTYPKGTDVVINILAEGYEELRLYDGTTLKTTVTLAGTNDVTLSSLDVSQNYKACLYSESSGESDFTYFEVAPKGSVSSTVDVSYSGSRLSVTMKSSNSKKVVPTYVQIGDDTFRYMLKEDTSKSYTWYCEGDFTITAKTAKCVLHAAGKYGAYTFDSITIN